MYAKCGVSTDQDILEVIETYSANKKAAAYKVIEDMEAEAAGTMQLAPGVLEMANWLHAHEIKIALVTRNTQKTVSIFHERLWKPFRPFEPAISRDFVFPKLPPKPDPAALFYIADLWNCKLPSDDIIMVGDSPSNDIVFGKRAGVKTVLVDTGRKFLEKESYKINSDAGADLVVESLALLPHFIEQSYSLVEVGPSQGL